MKFNALEQAMLDGAHGDAARWGIEYQQRVGAFFDAEDFAPVRLIHISTDRETMGGSGVSFIRELGELAPESRRPRAFAVADFRGFDEETFQFLLPGRDLAGQNAEAAEALGRLGVSTAHAYVNDHSVTAPVFGEACGYSGTPSVIYMNSLVGARCNFEAGPSSLAAFFTGRVPRYGFHLTPRRRATHAYRLAFSPENVAEWGAVGAIIGRALNSYWSVPAIECAGPTPPVLSLNHMALNLASYGSVAMFHVIGTTPEAPDWETAFGGNPPSPTILTRDDIEAFLESWGGAGEKLDVVALSTPQLSITELIEIADMLEGRRVHPDTTFLAYAPLEIKEAAARIGLTQRIEKAGAALCMGMIFLRPSPRKFASITAGTA